MFFDFGLWPRDLVALGVKDGDYGLAVAQSLYLWRSVVDSSMRLGLP